MGAGINLFKTLFPSDYYPHTANTLMSAKPLSKVIKDSNNQTVATVNFSGTELRGLLKVGANGLYVDGDIDDGSGTETVRYGIVDLSTLSWSQTALTPDITDAYVTGGLQGLAKYPANNSTPILAICSDYMIMSVNSIYSNNKSIAMNNGGNLYVRNDGAGVSPTGYLIYELATPTTQTLTAWTNPIVAKEGGTEEFIDGNEFSIVDLGSLNYTYESSWNAFKTEIPTAIRVPSGSANAFCDIYTSVSGHYSGDSQPDMTMAINTSAHANGVCTFRNTQYGSDANAFKTAMNGVYLIYENTNSVGFQMFTGHDTVYGTDLSVKKAEFGTTVYGGSVDFTTGEVISNKNADGTDKTAETIAISPVMVGVNSGNNNIMTTAGGNNTVKYYEGV